MDKDVVRLESLKLAVSRTTDQKDILARAKEFEDFINGIEKKTLNAVPTSEGLTEGKDLKRPAKG